MTALTLRRVGFLIKDQDGDYPVPKMAQIFQRSGIEMVRLDSTPPGELDLILVMGGDGTVLRALCEYPGVPALAINYGTVGFLTAGDSDDLERIVTRLLAGDCFIEERLMLQSTFRGQSYNIVNELVVKGTTKMVSVDIIIDDVPIHTVRGDGVIVGTPTGSTSYLLSTGSSIVVPTVDCFILSGINEYRFSSRGLVLDSRSRVKLRISEATRETDIFAAHDGRDKIPISPGEEVTIQKAPDNIRLVFFEKGYFFRNLKSRLDW